MYNFNAAYNMGANLWGTTGIFLDKNSANFSVHNNVTENDTSGLRMNFTSYNEQVYSNQFGGNDSSIDGTIGQNWAGTQIYDNIFYNPTFIWALTTALEQHGDGRSTLLAPANDDDLGAFAGITSASGIAAARFSSAALTGFAASPGLADTPVGAGRVLEQRRYPAGQHAKH